MQQPGTQVPGTPTPSQSHQSRTRRHAIARRPTDQTKTHAVAFATSKQHRPLDLGLASQATTYRRLRDSGSPQLTGSETCVAGYQITSPNVAFATVAKLRDRDARPDRQTGGDGEIFLSSKKMEQGRGLIFFETTTLGDSKAPDASASPVAAREIAAASTARPSVRTAVLRGDADAT
ncbi:hypothetical protein Mal33_04830 [Rosistilla oblonga]|uniref:Uncharacterized protein n=1 Tax=Rosistilla oblonga TaxID=2527990 RepID=A0A518IN58_9BACT|nr:hypothetical protein Mal33_04830 [Rosistilla oblonga]